MNLLIVDDERHIVNWISGLFEKHPLVEAIYGAYSGAEAIAWMNRTRIDVVFTDIRMPRMNGIELMHEIQKKWPQCQIVFLTGYEEFNYVYEAIRHPGVQYLLKTEDDEAIVSALENAAERLREAYALTPQDVSMRYGDLLTQSEWIYALRMGEPAEISSLPFQWEEPLYLLLGHFVPESEGASHRDVMVHRLTLYEAVCKHLGFFSHVAQHMLPDDKYIWLLQPIAKPEDFATHIMGYLDVIQSAVPGKLSIIFCEAPMGAHALNEGIEALLNQWSAGYADDFIVTSAGAESKPPPIIEYAVSSGELSRRLSKLPILQTAFESGREGLLIETVGDIMRGVESIESMHDMSAIRLYSNVALALYNRILERNLTQDAAFYMSLHKLINPSAHSTWKKATEYLTGAAHSLMAMEREKAQTHTHSIMTALCRYIEQHIDGDLSLVALSEHMHYNPSYLSRFFKRGMGVNLNEYIAGIRMRRARELLKTTHMSISAIAASVGFDNAQYFATAFKKRFNMTPQTYRDAPHDVKKQNGM